MGKRELVALLGLSSWCLLIVVWIFLAVPWVCLQFVIVVFTDHTHLLFFLSVHCSLVVTCWERANLWLGYLVCDGFSCVFVTFPCDGLCQVWYFMVLIPDLCPFSIFYAAVALKYFFVIGNYFKSLKYLR